MFRSSALDRLGDGAECLTEFQYACQDAKALHEKKGKFRGARDSMPSLLVLSTAQFYRVQDTRVPSQRGIASDCTFWDIVGDKSQNCAYFEDLYGLQHKVFVEYNPSVKDDCSGIQEGHSYCLEVNHGLPRDDNPPKVSSTEGSKPEPTGDKKPSPTQDGLIDTCTTFRMAKKGDTCAKIIAEYKTFDFSDFFKWNPAIDKDCSGIWAGYWYCVGVPGTPTSPPTITTTTSVKPTGPSKPTVTQEGLIESYASYHMAAKGETCAKIVSTYGIFNFDTFFKWNPACSWNPYCKAFYRQDYYLLLDRELLQAAALFVPDVEPGR
ncbi:hypothetical protein FOC1_g10008948 [Fusarium oxysporum f. sp. cubense race 1]|uniref:LysM domain-containing protein n=1 Tax=Fusarium oxysporum f. sp. cubense (strain race 1) TaxID=1229664 RepID=N4UCA8_FUSC1|nr:hypothetical protein FOC1_g10008948 [Fusarium oxysporum f. sp. cubense race 1]